MAINIEVLVYANKIGKRTLAKILREANAATMAFRLQTMLPRHFAGGRKTRPAGSYGYAKRGAGYLRVKRQDFGHVTPLVRRGRLRSVVLSQTGPNNIRKTQHGASWSASFAAHPMFGGAYETFKARAESDAKRGRPRSIAKRGESKIPTGPQQFVAEMEAIDAPEREALIDFWERYMHRELTNPDNQGARRRV